MLPHCQVGTVEGRSAAPAHPVAGVFGEGIPYGDPYWYNKQFKSPFYHAGHEEFRAKVRAFVEKEIRPFVHQWDEVGGRRSGLPFCLCCHSPVDPCFSQFVVLSPGRAFLSGWLVRSTSSTHAHAGAPIDAFSHCLFAFCFSQPPFLAHPAIHTPSPTLIHRPFSFLHSLILSFLHSFIHCAPMHSLTTRRPEPTHPSSTARPTRPACTPPSGPRSSAAPRRPGWTRSTT